MQINDLQQNPLVARVIEVFDADGNGEVDFKEFIEGISQFSVKGDKEAKLKFAFKVCLKLVFNILITRLLILKILRFTILTVMVIFQMENYLLY